MIEPANPQVVYVPQYNPQVVYTQPAPRRSWSQERQQHEARRWRGAVVGFAAGIAIGAAIDNDYYYGPYGWHGGPVHVQRRLGRLLRRPRRRARGLLRQPRGRARGLSREPRGRARERSERANTAQQERDRAQQNRQRPARRPRRRRRGAPSAHGAAESRTTASHGGATGTRAHRRRRRGATAGASAEARGTTRSGSAGAAPGLGRPERHAVRRVLRLLERQVRSGPPARAAARAGPQPVAAVAGRGDDAGCRAATNDMTIARYALSVVARWRRRRPLRVARASRRRPRAFATPEEAVAALLDAAAKASDLDRARRALRDRRARPRVVVRTGDRPPEPRRVRRRDGRRLAARRAWRRTARNSSSATKRGRFPVPLVKTREGWMFDAAAGKEEVLTPPHRAQRARRDPHQRRPTWTAQRLYARQRARRQAGRPLRAPLRQRGRHRERAVLAGDAAASRTARSGRWSRRRRRRAAPLDTGRRGADPVPRLLLPRPRAAGRVGAGRGAELRRRRRDVGRVRPDRVARGVRRHRHHHLHRQPGRRRVREGPRARHRVDRLVDHVLRSGFDLGARRGDLAAP